MPDQYTRSLIKAPSRRLNKALRVPLPFVVSGCLGLHRIKAGNLAAPPVQGQYFQIEVELDSVESAFALAHNDAQEDASGSLQRR